MMEEKIIFEWSKEFNHSIIDSDILFVALFSTNKELIFANKAISLLFKDDPCQNLINPTFDALLLLDNTIPLIFDGFLTLGDYSSISTSISAQIYRKENRLLIIGGVKANHLIDQNITMHNLNRDLSNLQRELIKEKHVLELTLNQLNKTNDDLNKHNANKDRFISILAHDLKSPFHSILGFLGLLIEKIHKDDTSEIEIQLSIINNVAQSTYNL